MKIKQPKQSERVSMIMRITSLVIAIMMLGLKFTGGIVLIILNVLLGYKQK